jgi:hypothetical protein
MDMYMSVVGQMMVYAVFENVYVQYVFEHYAERSAKHLDMMSRKLFPTNFVMQVTVMFSSVALCEDGCVMAINIAMHVWVTVFLFGLVAVAYYEYKTSIRRIVSNELKRIRHLTEAHEAHSDIFDDLLINPIELRSMFQNADKDKSGYAEVSEIIDWLDKELRLGDDVCQRVASDLREMCPEDFEKGITVHTFSDILRKIFACIVIPRDGSKGGDSDLLFRTLQAVKHTSQKPVGAESRGAESASLSRSDGQEARTAHQGGQADDGVNVASAEEELDSNSDEEPEGHKNEAGDFGI